MKKFTKIASIIAAAVATASLAGCMGGAGCSGCGGAKVSNNALTNSNWYIQTGYKGIQPYFVDGDHETLKYEVTADTKSNGFYKVEYSKGEYVTDFYATAYDWNDENVPEKYRAEKTETLYCYTTEFKISGKFVMGDSEKEFTDSVKSVSYFRSASFNLQPVYSKQELKTTSPAAYRPANIEAAYAEYDVVYETHYNYACTEATSVKTDKKSNNEQTTKTYGKLHKTSNSLFDNNTLYIAIRSLKLSDSLSQTIDLLNAASGGISAIKLAGGGTAIEKEELATISAALAAKDLYLPVTKDEEGNDIEDKGIPTVAVSIAYDGGDMSGTTQTVWYAALNDTDNNTARCTMLKLALPLPFGLGTLNYSLKEVSSTIWNG